MNFNNLHIIIPTLAILYLIVVYLLLTLAQRSKKVMQDTPNNIINSSQTIEN